MPLQYGNLIHDSGQDSEDGFDLLTNPRHNDLKNLPDDQFTGIGLMSMICSLYLL